jgi:hypothetical protein
MMIICFSGGLWPISMEHLAVFNTLLTYLLSLITCLLISKQLICHYGLSASARIPPRYSPLPSDYQLVCKNYLDLITSMEDAFQHLLPPVRLLETLNLTSNPTFSYSMKIYKKFSQVSTTTRILSLVWRKLLLTIKKLSGFGK